MGERETAVRHGGGEREGRGEGGWVGGWEDGRLWVECGGGEGGDRSNTGRGQGGAGARGRVRESEGEEGRAGGEDRLHGERPLGPYRDMDTPGGGVLLLALCHANANHQGDCGE